MTTPPTAPHDSAENTSAAEQVHPLEQRRREQVAAYPFVALTLTSTGIHPSTGRILAIDAVCFNAEGELGQDYYVVLNPDTHPGPRHQHGLNSEELAGGQNFAKVLKSLDRLIDDRVLIVHGAPMVWGFIVAEARKAMTAAARANRSRQRNRGRRRRQKVGHVPQPVRIIDTLASARRQGQFGNDERLNAIAADCGLTAPAPQATMERARRAAADVMREESMLLAALARHLGATAPDATANNTAAPALCAYVPDDLRADRFGLQRSHVRVDAANAPRQHENPGFYQAGQGIKPGMEFTIAPEVTANPDELIAAGMRAELNYVEKLSRETSFVVCNKNDDLVGKAMHAQRKDIPLLADADFLALLPEPTVAESPATAPGTAGATDAPAGRTTGKAAEGAASASKPAPEAESAGEATRKPRRRRGSRGGHNRRRRNSGKPAQPNTDS